MPWTIQKLTNDQREALLHSLDILENNKEYLSLLSKHSNLKESEVKERFKTYRSWLSEDKDFISPSQNVEHGGLDVNLRSDVS